MSAYGPEIVYLKLTEIINQTISTVYDRVINLM